MSNKRIILFFLTGILLCLVILFAGRGNRRFLVVPDQRPAYLVRGIVDEVSSVTIERAGGRMEIGRDGSRWRMTAPIDAAVDRGVMGRLVNGFESVAIKDRLTLNEIRDRDLSLTDYGLSPPRARVTFLAAGRQFTFLFGTATASGGDIYVRKNHMDQVWVVPIAVYDAIPAEVDELRSRRLADCDPVLVRSIAIRRPGHPFIRLALKEGVWLIEEPISAKASQERVGRFLQSLLDVRVLQFVWPSLDNVMDVADYERALKTRKGLYRLDEESGSSISIQTIDGSFDTTVVFGGRTDKVENSIYTLLDNGRAIGTVSNSFTSVISVEPEYFRGMRIFDGIAGLISRAQIMIGSDLFVLSRTNELWQIDSPVSEPADQRRVQRAIDAIVSLKADRIVHSVQPDESGDQGFETGYIELTSGSETLLCSVKKADYAGQAYELAFANSHDVYYVAGSNMPPALISRDALLDFRDKNLLSLPENSISRVTVKKSGETAFVAEYARATQTWFPAGGDVGGRLNQDAFRRILRFLYDSQADQVAKIGLSPSDPEYYGFTEPWLEINLDLHVAEAVRRTLLIGRSAGGNLRYAMRRGDQSVFLIDEQRLAVFTETLTTKDDH